MFTDIFPISQIAERKSTGVCVSEKSQPIKVFETGLCLKSIDNFRLYILLTDCYPKINEWVKYVSRNCVRILESLKRRKSIGII